MTVDELKEKTKHLEGELQQALEDFESETGFGVAEVRVVEPYHDKEDETSHNQEVEVRLERHPQRPPKRETKILQRSLKKLLGDFESGTGCRVTEVLVRQEVYEVQVRLDPLPYPQRFLKEATKRLEGDLQELLCDFARSTQKRVAEILVTEEGPENYDVQVRVALPAPESPGRPSRIKRKDGHATTRATVVPPRGHRSGDASGVAGFDPDGVRETGWCENAGDPISEDS